MKLIWVLLFFFVNRLSVAQDASTAATNAVSQEHLRMACTSLLADPLVPAGLQTLLDYSRCTTGNPQLKSRSMAAYALSALARGETNLFDRAQRSHAAIFSNDRDLIKVQIGSCYRACKACGGAGYTERAVACGTCNGVNKCATCKGTGKWQTVSLLGTRGRPSNLVNCAKCRGTGYCPDCNGISSARQKCATCKAEGFLFERPPALYENYESLLTAMLSLINAEETVAARIRQAMAETDIKSRIRAFEKFLSEFRHRPEAARIENLLSADKQTVQSAEDKLRAQAEQFERDLTTLRGLSHADNTKASITTIREYLAQNPESPHKLEIQGFLHVCTARLEHKRERIKWAYILGGLLIVLFGLSCIHINFFNYTLLPSGAANARRRKLNLEHISDPLALTEKERSEWTAGQ